MSKFLSLCFRKFTDLVICLLRCISCIISSITKYNNFLTAKGVLRTDSETAPGWGKRGVFTRIPADR